MDKDPSYKNTLKSTVVFGGAQAVQMIITVLRAKIIAIAFGSHGMGINAIFQSTISVISSFSSFGIFQSAVRDISQEYESGNKPKFNETRLVFKRLVLGSAILGLLFCLIGSFKLSRIAFQNSDYTIHFLILSIGIFFTALSNGETVLLQSTRKLTFLAKSSLLGALISLLLSIPFFYYFGIIGIAISISSSSLILFLTQLFWTRKLKFDKSIKLSLRDTTQASVPIIKLGTILMLGTVILTGFTYLTNVFIGRYGNINDIGYFQGISSITNQSIAIVIAILASDFFPRVSSVYKETELVKKMVNQQAELVSLIIGPISVILIVFAPLIVKLLLSQEFLIMVPFLRLLAMTLLFKGIWLIMSYIILANGDKKAYLIYDSLIGNGFLFLSNILSYKFWGLNGLVISSFFTCLFVAIILTIVVKSKYNVFVDKKFTKVFIIIMAIIFLTYANVSIFTGIIQYCLSFLLLLIICFYSLIILNRSINFSSKIKSFLKPNN